MIIKPSYCKKCEHHGYICFPGFNMDLGCLVAAEAKWYFKKGVWTCSCYMEEE